MTGGGGADTLDGGTGTADSADYGSHSGVTVSLDNAANDGSSGEGDNVKATVEDVLGSSGADTITGSASDNVLVGQGGVDTLNGGDGSDRLCGEFGFGFFGGGFCSSSFFGSSSNTLNGGTGDDHMAGGTAADVFNGGTGNDTGDLSDHGTDVTVTLDGVANDGASGEGDNVKADVENAIGGSGSDTLTGSALNNVLVGGPGALDTLNGGGGSDMLVGSSGADSMSGGTGFDYVTYQATARSSSVPLLTLPSPSTARPTTATSARVTTPRPTSRASSAISATTR